MSESVEVAVIGRISTPWRRREDAPHQPTPTPEAEGIVEVAEPFRAGLADLESFDRIWLIFRFDRNTGWTPRVKTPRGGPKRGLFATRAPHRPSQLGLTCVALKSVDVDAGRVAVQGVDLLDGTPILDIKPYIPAIDAWPDAGNGWLEPYLEKGVEPRLKKPRRPERD